MPFDQNNLPEWNAPGVEPPQSKKDNGWGTGEKPPSDWFNWFFNKTYNALKSLFTNAQHKEEKGQPNGYASLDKNAKVPTSQLPIATTTSPGAISASDKAKLDGIAPGAEVNQNAFSNVKVGATTIAADSKTDTLELVAGDAVTITPDATNDRVTIAVPNATSSASGAMSAADKAKLDSIQPGAEPNQNAFSNVKVGTTIIAADSKTDTLELVAGSNISLTPDTANDKITIAATVPVTSVNGKTGNVSLTASDVGAETPDGAQAKANTAENNAKAYADRKVVTAENNAKAYADTKADQAETNAKNASLPRTGGDVTGLLRVRHNEFRVGANDDFIIRPVGNGVVDILTPNGDLAPHFNNQLNFYKGVPGYGILKFSIKDDGVYVPAGKLATEAVAQAKADQAEINAKAYTDQQLATHSTETASKFTNINLNIIDMAVELETLKGATLNGVTANIFIETFTNLNDINLMRGSYDSVNKRLVV